MYSRVKRNGSYFNNGNIERENFSLRKNVVMLETLYTSSLLKTYDLWHYKIVVDRREYASVIVCYISAANEDFLSIFRNE